MIIDFHAHCFPDEIACKAVPELASRAGIPAVLDGRLSSIKNSMTASGVDASVILSIATRPAQTRKINDWSAQIQDDSIIAFGSIHPDYADWKDELCRIKQLGLKGIKLHPDYQEFYVDEKRMFPIYEKAFELGLIIVFHAGDDIGLPPPYHCTPDRLLNIVKAFPGGRFVAAHMGGYGLWDEVEDVLAGEDIYLDTSYCLGVMSDMQAVGIIKKHGWKKVLFATDSPWTSQSDHIRKIKSLNLGSEAEAAILGENARLLLDI